MNSLHQVCCTLTSTPNDVIASAQFMFSMTDTDLTFGLTFVDQFLVSSGYKFQSVSHGWYASSVDTEPASLDSHLVQRGNDKKTPWGSCPLFVSQQEADTTPTDFCVVQLGLLLTKTIQLDLRPTIQLSFHFKVNWSMMHARW